TLSGWETATACEASSSTTSAYQSSGTRAVGRPVIRPCLDTVQSHLAEVRIAFANSAEPVSLLVDSPAKRSSSRVSASAPGGRRRATLQRRALVPPKRRSDRPCPPR